MSSLWGTMFCRFSFVLIGVVVGVPQIAGAESLVGWTGVGGTWQVDNGVTARGPNLNYSGVGLYISPDTYGSHILRGKMWVTETSHTDNGSDWDDDFLGIAFGLQNPLGSSSAAHQYFLIDWKQAFQNTPEGFRLMRFDRTETTTLFFDPAAPPAGVNVISTNSGDNLGWEPNVTYSFTLEQTANHVKFAIQGGSGAFADGLTVFDVNGVFPEGRFAFATYSQPNNAFQFDGAESITVVPLPTSASAGLLLMSGIALCAYGRSAWMRRRLQ